MRKISIIDFGYKGLFILARSQVLRPFLIRGIANMNKFFPRQVVSETDTLVCFHHPRPEYPIHILLVPKEEIRDLLQFDPENQAFLRDLFTEVFRLVQELSLEQKGYRLILNGGDYQDFPQLHFHLIGGE
jgi:histidine triad (HIT) family protein